MVQYYPASDYVLQKRHNIQAFRSINIDIYYYPLEKCNKLWHYNFSRQVLHEELGDNYFAPDAILVKLLENSQAAFVTTLKFDYPVDGFCEALSVDIVTNVEPSV